MNARGRRPRSLAAGLRALAALAALAALSCGLLLARGKTGGPPPGPPRVRVDFIDVGHGDAILITSPTGKTVLIDGGLAEAGDTVAAFVRARGEAPLDLVLLTHRHADHLGGLARVIAAQGARSFMDAAFPHPTPAYDRLIRLLEQRRIPVLEAKRGRAIDLGGGARLTLLTPPEPLIVGSRSDPNANSLVTRLDFGTQRMLLTGDAEAVTEAWLLDTRSDLRADLLKLAHHGSRYSSTADFLRAVAPRIAVASCGPPGEPGHLTDETRARVTAMGARLYRTDVDGNITAWSDGRDITVETQHPHVGSDQVAQIAR